MPKKAKPKLEQIDVRPLTPERWEDLEALFGPNGACAGCWCMFWRLDEGERFDDVKGAQAKKRMKLLVKAGKARGLLAYVEGRAVGWATLGPRREFKKLDRAPSLVIDDADRVHSVPCFFIHKDFRSQGVATALLDAAVKTLRDEGAEVIEGYPVKGAGKMADAFTYTGTVPMFEKAGFKVVGARPKGKQRVRLQLSSAASPASPRRSRGSSSS